MHKKISIILLQIFFVFTEEENVWYLSTVFRKTDQCCDTFNYTRVETSNQDCYYIRKSRKHYVSNNSVLSQPNETNLNVINKKDQITIPTSSLNEFDANGLTIFSMLVMYYLLKKFVGSTLEENGSDDKIQFHSSNEINSGIPDDTKIVASTLEENGSDDEIQFHASNEINSGIPDDTKFVASTLEENESDDKIQFHASKEIHSGIPDDTNKTFTQKTYESLREQYDKINDLDLSKLTECLEIVNKFNESHKAEIISFITNESPITEEIELSLNCLYVSINIISKYIEHHLPSVYVSDSSLVGTFDGFCNFISTHHLAERICESILYAMCSLMKLSNNEVNKEFWNRKLVKLFLNDKLSEENKLASCVILVQLDISNKYFLDIHKYLSDIDIESCEEYFGFTKSEIISARSISEKKIENLSKATTNKFQVTDYKLRFQIANQIDKTELFVSKFDNVIKLKKSICDGNMNDYKRMIMKYKGVTLDNNQFLLSCIDSTNISPIFCEFDDNDDVDATIVIKLNIYPEMLQIWKYQTIKHLKIIISKLNKTNHEDLLIFYKSNQLDDDDKSIDYYKIEDNDWIIVMNKSQEMQNISMKSIFSAKETISIEISKFEKVESIINKSIEKIQHKMVTNHFAVFINNKLLENEKFIYEYNIDSKSLVEFVYFKRLDEIVDNERLSTMRDFGRIRLLKAVNKIHNKPILFKAYNKNYMEMEHNGDFSMILKTDLQKFQITKSHSRFIQLFGIYNDYNWIFIGMENSTMILMRTFLSSNNEIPLYEISKWANQILEGLKHLHNHNIIFKTMNPMNIWIDGNHDVKLPSFNTSQYLNHINDENANKHRDCVLSYLAPEILKGEPYDASVDLWSLGAVMIEVITRGHIYPELKESEIVQIIKESHTIEYDKTNKPADLINFIDCCLKGDPEERSTIDQLMKHEFIEKYL